MVNYWEEKEMKVPLAVMIIILIAGVISFVFFYAKNNQIKNDLKKKVSILEGYLKDENKIPTKEKIGTIEAYKAFQQNQIDTIVDQIKKKGDFSNVFPEVNTPLEMKDFIAKKSADFQKEDLGFEEYLKKVPEIKEIYVLKRQLALICKILNYASKNNISQVGKIVRQQPVEIKSDNKVLFIEYPCLVSLSCQTKSLASFLYDISSAEELLRATGIEIISSEDKKILEVVVKISYIEMVK